MCKRNNAIVKRVKNKEKNIFFFFDPPTGGSADNTGQNALYFLLLAFLVLLAVPVVLVVGLCISWPLATIFLNLSNRPLVSNNFCLPVKNGWHFEQTSTWISGIVEPTVKILPQLQIIFALG